MKFYEGAISGGSSVTRFICLILCTHTVDPPNTTAFGLSWENGCFANSTAVLRGPGGVPWVQIMENEFGCLVVIGVG